MSPESKAASAVYASWVTVQNALDALAQGVPPQIDRSLFPGLNWAVQSQLLTGLRFLKLIDDNGNSTPELVALAEDRDCRKENWVPVLKAAYREVFAIDLTKASPLQLENAIQRYGVTGDTLEKAVRFFIAAAEFSGIPLSPHLQRRRKQVAPRKRRAQARIKADALAAPSDSVLHPKVPDGTTRTIALRSGGTLEFSVSVDLFGLSSEDRKFVFTLIDELHAYEQKLGQDNNVARLGEVAFPE